jgi:hypothetical protein
MNVSYVAFLETHLHYLISRMVALEGEKQREMFDQVKKVRDLLNTEEELQRIRKIQVQLVETPSELA